MHETSSLRTIGGPLAATVLLISVAAALTAPRPERSDGFKHKVRGAFPETPPPGGFHATLGPTRIRAGAHLERTRRWHDEGARAAADGIRRMAEDPDVYMARRRILAVKEAWGGAAVFDAAFESIEARFRQEPARSQLRLGRRYHQILATAERRPSAAAVAALQRFAREACAGSFYGEAALAAAEEIRQRLEPARARHVQSLKSRLRP